VHIHALKLEHFRCYARLDLDLGPGLHILVGPNAGGKTSVLEAVGLLALTKSHRTSQDKELVQWGQEWARIDGAFTSGAGRPLSLRATIRSSARGEPNAPRKTMELNRVPRARAADIVGQVPIVVFGPEDLGLVKGPPSGRRRFLNEAIAQIKPGYLADLMRYRRALRQRNECLKTIRRDPSARELLDAWDVPLVEGGAAIATGRAQFVASLEAEAERSHHRLSNGRERLQIKYTGDLAECSDLATRRDRFREALRTSVDRDLTLGRTAIGPHRDELDILVGGKSLRTYGSQGQQRTAALSLTLAEAAVIYQWREEAPIVLLDDCLSELDSHRAKEMLGLSHTAEQMLVTTASWDPLLDQFAADARVYDVGDGLVQRRG